MSDSPTAPALSAPVPSAPPRRRRRRGMLGSLLATVLVPVLCGGIYLYGFASDQYETEFRFNVRQQQPLKMDNMSIGSAMGGGNPLLAAIADSEVVVQYLKSRDVVDHIAGHLDMNEVYSPADADWWSRMRPDAKAEDRVKYWRGVVDPFFDMTSGIVTVRVRAFRPEDAVKVAATALELSEKLINQLSARAHDDALAYAQREMESAEGRLTEARVAIAKYRNENAVLYPTMQATSSTGVEGRLRESLAELRASYNAQLSQYVSASSLHMRTLQSRIEAMEGQIREVNSQLSRPNAGSESASLASVLSQYSAFESRERIAERGFENAMTALQRAKNEASQQLVYLNAFVHPALPEKSLYPNRWRQLLEIALASLVAWCLGALLIQGVRDHMR